MANPGNCETRDGASGTADVCVAVLEVLKFRKAALRAE